MDGVVNVLKPPGMISQAVTGFIKRLFRAKRAGHVGTLDPQAAGCLPVCINQGTRIVRFLIEEVKEYRAEMVLGITTSTQDSTGEVISEIEEITIGRADIEAAFKDFLGEQLQTPPMFSAARHQGRHLYQLARKQEWVERKPKTIKIYRLDLVEFIEDGRPCVIFDVVCSKGTYVRTLCHDIGNRLGCGAHMGFCVRTRVGNFYIQDAFTLVELYNLRQLGELESALISMDSALGHFPGVTVDGKAVRWLRDGITIGSGDVLESPELDNDALVRLRSSGGQLIAIGKVLKHMRTTKYKPICVFRV